MSRKRPGQMISRFSELLHSGNRTGSPTEFIPTSPSPRSPRLECRIHSPRGVPKKFDLAGGVGLGIVAALEKSSGRSTERSDPIPVGPCKNSERNDRSGGGDGVDKESFTYVTSHRPDDKLFTKVYYDAGEHGKVVSHLPPKSLEVAVNEYPTLGFLNSCNLCKKKLHGKDIYMYRGEKAFCSAECRSRQIMVDEHREQCRSEVVPRSADLSSSPYAASPIFSAGILAI